MEGKNTQKLIFDIPNKFIEEITKSSKEKKNEILDLLKNHNQLKTEAEFREIEFSLRGACREGDLEYIKILLSETIKDDFNDLLFKIDKTNHTASLFKICQIQDTVFIPRTARHENKEYLITSITSLTSHFNSYSFAYFLKSIKFNENSSVRTIYGSAFALTCIEEIYFPKTLVELKKEWCRGAKINKIIVSPSNEQFIFKDDKYLLGKSDINNDEFDTLLFVRRDIKEFCIPSNIKIIGSFSFSRSSIEEINIPPSLTKICQSAFSNCSNLNKVSIPTNSNLQIIEDDAFSNSAIEEINIPSNVTKICKYAFDSCRKLSKVIIPTDSNLQIIESFAFSSSIIEELYFPKSLVELEKGWCALTRKLNKIIVSPSNEQFIFKDDKYLLGKSDISNDEFDTLLFVRRDIKEICIPSNIKIIGSFSFENSAIEEINIPPSLTKICQSAFSNCSNLRKVSIPTNSNLQTIEEYAFSHSAFEEINIPSSLTKICEGIFCGCSNLIKVKIPTDSNLQTIEKCAFYDSTIEEIYFPKTLVELKKEWCRGAKINKIIVSPSNEQFIFKDDKYLLGKSDINNDEFDTLLFVRRDIKEFCIPSNIKIIGSFSFSRSFIEEINIPPSLTKICQSAFSDCSNLRKVSIPTNSNLQTIELCSFSHSAIEEINIPSNVTKICKYAFSSCNNLRKVGIPTNSNLQSIESYAFSHSAIEVICIPSSVTKICEYAFSRCNNLRKVGIPTNSSLQIIESCAFDYSAIKAFFIPSSVTKIGEYPFSFCKNLLIIEISEESKLQSMPISAFIACPNLIIMIPISLKKLIQTINST